MFSPSLAAKERLSAELNMHKQRRKAVTQRTDTAPVAGDSPSSSALFALVRVLARQVARETFPAQQQATVGAKPMSLVVHAPDGSMEKNL